MAVDMFLQIDDVKGESVDNVHAEEIDVLSWSWGVSQSGTVGSGSGGGSGKANVQDISVTKYVDRSSPVLTQLCFKGKHLKNAVLTVRKAGETPLEYMRIKMQDVFISSVTVGGGQGEERLTENVTLLFGQMKYDYRQQKEDGSGEAPVACTWNITKNCEEVDIG